MNHRAFRVALFAAGIFAFVGAAHGRALAIVEYCGASASLTPVGAATGTPATTYAVRLSANSSRTVSGDISVQTDDGWYEIPFDGVNLTARTRRFEGPSAVFTRTDFESPALFAAFSSPAVVRAAFVSDARVTDEHTLGWDSQSHACAGSEYDPKHPETTIGKDIVALDPDAAPTPPPPGTPLLHPVIASAPGPTDCALPFAPARASEAMRPDLPVGYHIDQVYQSLIEIAVGTKGELDGAWVYAPSGVKAFDDAALRAARLSTYEAPRAFCRDVPGVYIFRAMFHP